MRLEFISAHLAWCRCALTSRVGSGDCQTVTLSTRTFISSCIRSFAPSVQQRMSQQITVLFVCVFALAFQPPSSRFSVIKLFFFVGATSKQMSVWAQWAVTVLVALTNQLQLRSNKKVLTQWVQTNERPERTREARSSQRKHSWISCMAASESLLVLSVSVDKGTTELTCPPLLKEHTTEFSVFFPMKQM